MNIPDMPCPHGWINCYICENLRLCRAGLYRPDIDIVEIAVEVCEEVVQEEAVESVRSIKRDLHAEFMNMSLWSRMKRNYQFEVRGLQQQTTTLGGPIILGGGSKSGKIKKSKRGNKVTVEAWTSYV